MSEYKICEKYNLQSSDLNSLGYSSDPIFDYKYLYHLTSKEALFTDYYKTISYSNQIFQKYKYDRFVNTKVIDKVVRTNLLFPVTTDLFDKLYFAISSSPLELWEIPEESKIILSKNTMYSKKIFSIVIVTQDQMAHHKTLNLDINPYNSEDGYYIDEFFPAYIQNFNHNSRMFAFLNKNQTIQEFAQFMIRNGATYSNKIANYLNNEADSIYLTTGDL